MNGEFEKIKPLLPNVVCNTTAAKEHVAEIERNIRVVKERATGTAVTLPFMYLPKCIKIELIYFVVFWLNAFPSKAGVSRKYSLRGLVLRLRGGL